MNWLNLINNDVTLWVLIIFFGMFAVNNTWLYYVKKKTFGWFQALLWWCSVIITAIMLGYVM